MPGDKPVDVDGLHLERMLAREGEQPLHQGRGALGGLTAIAEPAADALLALDAAQREIEIADDRGEQVVEVVRDAAGEAADRFHLLRLAQRFLGRLAPRDLLAQHLVGRGLAPRARERHDAERDQPDGRRKPKIRWRDMASIQASVISAVSRPVAT